MEYLLILAQSFPAKSAKIVSAMIQGQANSTRFELSENFIFRMYIKK